jgi:hypothetical protein
MSADMDGVVVSINMPPHLQRYRLSSPISSHSPD